MCLFDCFPPSKKSIRKKTRSKANKRSRKKNKSDFQSRNSKNNGGLQNKSRSTQKRKIMKKKNLKKRKITKNYEAKYFINSLLKNEILNITKEFKAIQLKDSKIFLRESLHSIDKKSVKNKKITKMLNYSSCDISQEKSRQSENSSSTNEKITLSKERLNKNITDKCFQFDERSLKGLLKLFDGDFGKERFQREHIFDINESGDENKRRIEQFYTNGDFAELSDSLCDSLYRDSLLEDDYTDNSLLQPCTDTY